MSPRAAWRLEALGFEHVFDYVGGKADWLAHGLPREGRTADVPYAGDLLDEDVATCRQNDELGTISAALASSRHGFCLVVNEGDILLGIVRRRSIDQAKAAPTADALMEPGPSTVRPSTPALALLERLAERDLQTAIVTTPEGRLLGVVSRAAAEPRLMSRKET